MAQDLARADHESTTSLAVQRNKKAVAALAQSSTPDSVALKAAKTLVRQWPHARPPDADAWQIAIGAKLSTYPPMIVEECCDPRTGLATVREFPPTVQAVTDWCDHRLQYHRNWANYRPVNKPINKPDPPVKHPSIGQWLMDLGKRLRQFPKKPKPEPARQAPTDDELRAYYKPQSEAAE
jgi:hypothetical protein